MKAAVDAKAKKMVLEDYAGQKEAGLLSSAVLPILPFGELPME